jgi:hypothetical protein
LDLSKLRSELIEYLGADGRQSLADPKLVATSSSSKSDWVEELARICLRSRSQMVLLSGCGGSFSRQLFDISPVPILSIRPGLMPYLPSALYVTDLSMESLRVFDEFACTIGKNLREIIFYHSRADGDLSEDSDWARIRMNAFYKLAQKKFPSVTIRAVIEESSLSKSKGILRCADICHTGLIACGDHEISRASAMDLARGGHWLWFRFLSQA